MEVCPFTWLAQGRERWGLSSSSGSVIRVLCELSSFDVLFSTISQEFFSVLSGFSSLGKINT